MKKDVELPEKFSDGMQLALDDARKCAADPAFVFDMGQWIGTVNGEDYGLPEGPLCAVCMAGAVMAQTFEVNPDDYTNKGASPYGGLFDSKTERKLAAINSFRTGDVRDAITDYTGMFPECEPGTFQEIQILMESTSYEFKPTQDVYFANWQRAIDMLRQLGY